VEAKHPQRPEEKVMPTLVLRFADERGSAREVIAQRACTGGTLVIDRAQRGGGDARLLAHLAPEEPLANAELTARSYAGESPRGGRPRRVLEDDRHGRPEGEREPARFVPDGTAIDCERGRRSYRLGLVDSAMSIRELRWRAFDRELHRPVEPRIVSLREVVGSLEAYEPALGITAAALASGDAPADGELRSCSVLRQEHARVCASPIVLNRGVREAVLAALARGDTSMSEIAIRCGRVKRDRRGNVSGETSWLARRVGLLAEGGASRPTPWIHTDVLALIARRGLGLSPREVEL
jgi:hypothetical protein